MTRSVTLPVGPPPWTAQVRYNIELDWDYAYVRRFDGRRRPLDAGSRRTLLANESPNGQNFGEGITGTSVRQHLGGR